MDPWKLLSLLMTFVGGKQQQQQFDETTDAVNRRRLEARNLTTGLRDETMGKLPEFSDAETGLAQGGIQDLMKALSGSRDYAAQTGNLGQGQWFQRSKQLGQGWADLAGSLPGQYGQRADELGTGYGSRLTDLMGSFDQELGQLPEMYKAREGEVMGQLEGAGDQYRKDIAERGKQNEAVALQDLARRGLTGSTIAPTTSAGVQRETEGNMGRLEESLRQQRTDLASALSGDTLAARGNVGQLRSGLQERLSGDQMAALERLTGDTLGATERTKTNELQQKAGLWGDYNQAWDANTARNLGLQRQDALTGYGANRDLLSLLQGQNQRWLGANTDTTKNLINLLASFEDQYPQSNWMQQMAGLLGQYGNQPKTPDNNNWLGPAIGAGGNILSAFVGA